MCVGTTALMNRRSRVIPNPGTRDGLRITSACLSERFRRAMATIVAMLVFASALTVSASAQQRPLVTEDPETVSEGQMLVEAGFDYQRRHRVSGPGSHRESASCAGRRHQHRCRVEDGDPGRWRTVQPPVHHRADAGSALRVARCHRRQHLEHPRPARGRENSPRHRRRVAPRFWRSLCHEATRWRLTRAASDWTRRISTPHSSLPRRCGRSVSS